MDVSARSYFTAGVAALGVSALALAPLQPVSQGAALPAALTSSPAVQLAALDVVTPWLEVFNDSSLNIANLANSALGPNKSDAGDGNTIGAPLPSAQQWVANQLQYLSELPDVATIWSQFTGNVGNAVKAPFAVDLTTLNADHQTMYALLPTLAPTIPQALTDLLTTSLSGMLVGAVGPALAPIRALTVSVGNIITAIKASDWNGALTEFINIAPKMTGAFLNGGETVDLMFLAPILGLPASVETFKLALPGVLSAGGSALNSLDTSVRLAPPPVPTVKIPGVGAGPIGSTIGLGWKLASSIGWNRTGNPLKPGIPVPGAASRAVAPAAAAVATPPAAPGAAAVAAAPAAQVAAGHKGGRGLGAAKSASRATPKAAASRGR